MSCFVFFVPDLSSQMLLSESRAKESEASKQLTIARKNLARRNEVAKIPTTTVTVVGKSISPTPTPNRSTSHLDHQNSSGNIAEDEEETKRVKGMVDQIQESPTRRKQLFPPSYPPPPTYPPSSGPSSFSQSMNGVQAYPSASQVDCTEIKMPNECHDQEGKEQMSPQRKRRASTVGDDAHTSTPAFSNAPAPQDDTEDNSLPSSNHLSPLPAHGRSSTETGEAGEAAFASPMTAEVYLRTRRRSAEQPPSHRRAASPKANQIASPLLSFSFSSQPLSQAAAPATVASAMATAAAAATSTPEVAANKVEFFLNTPQNSTNAHNAIPTPGATLATTVTSATSGDSNQSAAMDELRRALGAQQEQIERLVASQQQQTPSSSQSSHSHRESSYAAASSTSQPLDASTNDDARAALVREEVNEAPGAINQLDLFSSLRSPQPHQVQRNSRTPDLPATIASPMVRSQQCGVFLHYISSHIVIELLPCSALFT